MNLKTSKNANFEQVLKISEDICGVSDCINGVSVVRGGISDGVSGSRYGGFGVKSINNKSHNSN